MKTNQTHEGNRNREIAVPASDRSFGLVMAAVFAVLTLINVWHLGRAWPWTGAVAVFFLVFASFRPAALRPLNWVWFKFGLHAMESAVNDAWDRLAPQLQATMFKTTSPKAS